MAVRLGLEQVSCEDYELEWEGLRMPAKSKAQQRFMAMVEHGKIKGTGISKGVAKEFAETARKGLPNHKKK